MSVKERVGAGNGPSLELTLRDETSGQELGITATAETGTYRFTTGGRNVVVKVMPSGEFNVAGTKTADPGEAALVLRKELPEAGELSPEMFVALFSVPASPEAGDKLIWELLIEPILRIVKDGVRAIACKELIGILEFFFAGNWFNVFCSIDPSTCDRLAQEALENAQ